MNGSKWTALVVLTLLQTADAVSTRIVIGAGGIELNPLVRGLSLYGAKVVVFTAVCLLAWMTTRPRRLWVLVGLYGGIVAWNSSLILLHR